MANIKLTLMSDYSISFELFLQVCTLHVNRHITSYLIYKNNLKNCIKYKNVKDTGV